jgi:4-hydroxy-2-oxoheptanedioate aldolase
VAGRGFDFVVLDVENGMFDLATLERHIPQLTGLGSEVFAKILGPAQESSNRNSISELTT